MSTEHIVKSFDEDLNRLDNVIAEMGGLVEIQMAEAISAMIKRDAEAAERVIRSDARIDALETDVDELTLRLLALRQPMAEDLRVVVTASRTASALERIGDYSKNIAKRTVALAQVPPAGPAKTIVRMANLVQGMITSVLDAYVSRDAESAAEIMQRDEEVDTLHSSLFRELLTYMMEDPRYISSGTHLMFVARNVERIGDHTVNIAKNINFMVLGSAPAERRPKGDASPYTVVAPEDVGGADI